MTTPKISILLPTRKRTEAVVRSIGSLLASADNTANIEILIAYDDDDTESREFFSTVWPAFIAQSEATTRVFETERFGYTQLNRYVNMLAENAQGEWLFFWNDDALMETDGWDTEVLKHAGYPGLLRMPCSTMNHPFALFPVIGRHWMEMFGQLSPVSHSDWWIYNVTAPLKLVKNIPVTVYHDRADVTGGNQDETYAERSYSADGRDPTNPYDYAHPQRQQELLEWIQQLRDYAEERVIA
jgi:hypothetical protein